jgi:hypothetical protein
VKYSFESFGTAGGGHRRRSLHMRIFSGEVR